VVFWPVPRLVMVDAGAGHQGPAVLIENSPGDSNRGLFAQKVKSPPTETELALSSEALP